MPEVITFTDYPSLQCGYPSSSRTEVSIVGLELVVFGLDEIKDSPLPVAAVITCHGRLNKKEQMEPFAHGLLGHLRDKEQGGKRRRDVIVVTLDQMNHGSRLRHPTHNLAYDKNEQHLTDMAAQVVGGCHDVNLIMTFLASYLFPHGERVIDEFIPTGFSLGGHLTWRLLREDPRITIGIPLLGLPFSTFPTYLRARALNMGLSFAPPLVPPTTLSYLDTPVQGDLHKYKGKKILSVHGKEDALVPFEQGRGDIEAIRDSVNGDGSGGGEGENGEGERRGGMEVKVVDGIGHVLVPDLVEMVADWVWRWAVVDEEIGEDAAGVGVREADKAKI